MHTTLHNQHLSPKKAHILVVDDNPGDIDILLELLQGYDVRTATDGASALESVAMEKPDLILLDINMPDMDGFEVCRQIKANEDTQDIPILFLSSRNDVDNIVKGFKLGGADYVTKPYLPQEMIARIQTHLQLSETISALNRLVYIDHLSGISNRRSFFTKAPKLFEDATKKHIPLHLFMIDMDNFKQINDTYGHSIGDKVIQGLTECVQKSVSKIDIFARLGGDEFVLVLTGISAHQAHQQLKQLMLNVQEASLSTISSAKVTISIGMVSKKDQDNNIEDLLIRADARLYKSKITKNTLHYQQDHIT